MDVLFCYMSISYSIYLRFMIIIQPDTGASRSLAIVPPR